MAHYSGHTITDRFFAISNRMFRAVSATTADWFEANPARLSSGRGIVPTD